MNKNVKLIFLITSICLLSAVTYLVLSFTILSPKLDATNEDTIQSSIAKMRDTLNNEQQDKLADALKVLVFSNLDFSDLLNKQDKPEGIMVDNLKKFNGSTAKQLIAAADDVTTKIRLEQKNQALSEIKDIEEKIQNAEKSKELLSKIEVIKSRFYINKDSFISQPIIELTIKNNTDKALSRVYFKGILASPGRSVPWVKDNFNYDVKGGLEPKETAKWQLAPNMYSDWGRTEAPKDAILTVTVVRADDADGKELANSEGSDEETLERLKKLKEFVTKN